ncbi:MAG TPA: hypothetical protein VF638_08175 [Sphingomonas sp.]|jgi:hypothetical protein
MRNLSMLAALPLLAAIGGCGQGERGGAGDIVTTNTGDVVLNDAQANYAFRGDNEQVAGQSNAVDTQAMQQANGSASGSSGNMQ